MEPTKTHLMITMLKYLKLYIITLSFAGYVATALSVLPTRPLYSFGRGRSAANSAATNSHPIGSTADVAAGAHTSMASEVDPPDDVKEREQLYGAYNALHSLAQDFKKPFDSPAVLVVGHQTSGKSALMEALMGFQFNQVGGGTKTRRPVALRMRYNPDCKTPRCFLTLESGKEEEKSLAEIQAYIESENKRLERDATRCYDPREINVRVEFKYCPNMIVIDTPGMLHAPKGTRLTPQQRALAQAAKECESLVLDKMKVQDYIILCVEDTIDWKHATTRNIVQQVDPLLSRTVLVSTKLDTKLQQFSEATDLEEFLRAPLIERLYPRALGGPFYTTVPAGRVGEGKEFESNDEFVLNMKRAEEEDAKLAGAVMSQELSQSRVSASLSNMGVSKLRQFLEERIELSYRKNVAKILPLLQTNLQRTEQELQQTDAEIAALSMDKLKSGANSFREKFSRELANVIHGTAKASPEECGETLDSEQLRGGMFLAEALVQSDEWEHILNAEVGNAKHKLFGGAQYHRAIREFTTAVRHMPAPPVTDDEIANAAGMGDMHDGVNFMRAACVLAMQKAQNTFDPLLEAMRLRSTYIMGRLFDVVADIVVPRLRDSNGMSLDAAAQSSAFQELIHSIYDKFVQEQINNCLVKCRDDLKGMTRFVTWDVDGRGGSSSLYNSLPTPQKMVEIYSVALENARIAGGRGGSTGARRRRRGTTVKNSNGRKSFASDESDSTQKRSWMSLPWALRGRNRNVHPVDIEAVVNDWDDANNNRDSDNNNRNTAGQIIVRDDSEKDVMVPDHYELLQLTEEMLAGRDANRTSTVISALVQFIVKSWQDHFAKTVAMKFNCFFLLPFIDEFPQYLRDELDKIYDSGGDPKGVPGFNSLFDVAEARTALMERRNELASECEANAKLQTRFDAIDSKMRMRGGSQFSADKN